MALDLSKLQNVRVTATGWSSACPVCRKNGSDKSGNHLAIKRSGEYHCAVGGGGAHSKAIFQLAGLGGSGEYNGESFEPIKPEIVVEKTWPLDCLNRLVQDHSYWTVKRGVPIEVLAPLKGGVATSGPFSRRYVFPIFNDRGEIHGFTGRAIPEKMEPRWLHNGKVSNWVWGDLAGIREYGRAILVEGVGCRLALDTRGVRGALPIWGLKIHEAVLAFLVSANPRDIVISLNNDPDEKKGPEAAARIKSVLDKLFSKDVTRIELPPRKDFLDNMSEADWTDYLARLNSPQDSSTKDLTVESSKAD